MKKVTLRDKTIRFFFELCTVSVDFKYGRYVNKQIRDPATNASRKGSDIWISNGYTYRKKKKPQCLLIYKIWILDVL